MTTTVSVQFVALIVTTVVVTIRTAEAETAHLRKTRNIIIVGTTGTITVISNKDEVVPLVT